MRHCRFVAPIDSGGGPSSITTWPTRNVIHPHVSRPIRRRSFAYPGNEILDGASLLIRPGDRLALLGPNGTGKSTALRLLAGDIAAGRGDVRVLGRASVAYLRQSQELSGAGTLLDALLEPFADVQRLHDQLTAIEAELARRRARRRSRATASCRSATSARAATSSRRGSSG